MLASVCAIFFIGRRKSQTLVEYEGFVSLSETQNGHITKRPHAQALKYKQTQRPTYIFRPNKAWTLKFLSYVRCALESESPLVLRLVSGLFLPSLINKCLVPACLLLFLQPLIPFRTSPQLYYFIDYLYLAPLYGHSPLHSFSSLVPFLLHLNMVNFISSHLWSSTSFCSWVPLVHSYILQG